MRSPDEILLGYRHKLPYITNSVHGVGGWPGYLTGTGQCYIRVSIVNPMIKLLLLISSVRSPDWVRYACSETGTWNAAPYPTLYQSGNSYNLQITYGKIIYV